MAQQGSRHPSVADMGDMRAGTRETRRSSMRREQDGSKILNMHMGHMRHMEHQGHMRHEVCTWHARVVHTGHTRQGYEARHAAVDLCSSARCMGMSPPALNSVAPRKAP